MLSINLGFSFSLSPIHYRFPRHPSRLTQNCKCVGFSNFVIPSGAILLELRRHEIAEIDAPAHHTTYPLAVGLPGVY